MQGIDYVYTINGWLKGINHPTLLASNDPGNDNNTIFGQDAFGICTTSTFTHKGLGLVEVLPPSNTISNWNLGLGHVRYPTNGSKTDPNLIQPFVSTQSRY